MKVFMLANVPKAWIVAMKGPYVPMKVAGESEVPKEEVEWNDEDLVKIMINNKAINMLQCALNPTEFHRVSECDTAKEMWDMLEVTHEGTSQAKESKINRLIYMYELFKMKPEESIQDMYTRLNDIVTNLKALGKVYLSQEVVRKVLRSLPKNWEAKLTTIEESKDLNTLKLEDLIGKLMTYEIEVQVDGGVEVVEKKKKNVAFKASNQKEESEDDASNDESSNEEDITKLISKEVKRFMKKNIKSKLAKRDEGESTKRSVKCYECNKMGHYRNECPKLKKGERKNKKSMKKKAFTATWSNDETSSTESEYSLENGVANLCFMAQEDSYNDEEFTPKDICVVLAIPEVEDDKFENVNHALVRATIAPNCTENQIKVGSLTPENRALQWIISYIIAQRKGSKSYVLASDLPWFDYLLNRKRVNLGRFIFRSIIKPYSPTTGLPHGALITRLVKRNNIDLTSFRNGIWIKKGEQEGDEEEGDTDQEMAEQGAEKHEGDSPRPFRVSMQRTNRKTMELMINEMRQLHTDFYDFRTKMRGRMDTVD
ncbi:hypothetical protein SLEP1_g53222 [Rubroshorea leprosula]|uniref:CCHC-type domain-containing protein n=1 Tax=Rubroshorea leprosula TaxID=152421 RepID=A0AAV5M8S6_9ROSI|nr:hypothetical protein SLEP1_g53222 [Rubroshorea leprosula]